MNAAKHILRTLQVFPEKVYPVIWVLYAECIVYFFVYQLLSASTVVTPDREFSALETRHVRP